MLNLDNGKIWPMLFLDGQIPAHIFEKLPIPENSLGWVFQALIRKGIEVSAEAIYIEAKDSKTLCEYIDMVNDVDRMSIIIPIGKR